MIDVRPIAYLIPIDEQVLDDITPLVRIASLADEDAIVQATIKIYRRSTGLLLYTALTRELPIAAGTQIRAAAEYPWSPPAPADDDYFIMCETLAISTISGTHYRGFLGAWTFNVKPGPMGPAPAAHAPTHTRGGMDELEVDDLATDETDTAKRLGPDGTGGLSWMTGGGGGGTPSDTVVSETSPSQTPAAGTASTYSRGDHTHGTPTNTPAAHAPSHSKGQSDELEVDDLATDETSTAKVLKPDGSGGVAWGTGGGGPGGSDTDVQYNDSGALAGSAALTFNKSATAPTLLVSGSSNYEQALELVNTNNQHSALRMLRYSGDLAVDQGYLYGNLFLRIGRDQMTPINAMQLFRNGIIVNVLKSGTSQSNAGAAANELWILTSDNSIHIGT
jgi:hypothetical protein